MTTVQTTALHNPEINKRILDLAVSVCLCLFTELLQKRGACPSVWRRRHNQPPKCGIVSRQCSRRLEEAVPQRWSLCSQKNSKYLRYDTASRRNVIRCLLLLLSSRTPWTTIWKTLLHMCQTCFLTHRARYSKILEYRFTTRFERQTGDRVHDPLRPLDWKLSHTSAYTGIAVASGDNRPVGGRSSET
jgi:hypothetical protein